MRGRASRLTRWDAAGMVAGLCLTLAVTYFLTRGRIFWEDELLGWFLLHDPSPRHMVRAWKMGADGGGFGFYVLGRAWFGLMGSSELAFRLFSSTCFGLAFAVTWAAARRYYPTWVVGFALFNTWFFSLPFVYHMTEGRFYGLLVLSTALAFWLSLHMAEGMGAPRYQYVLFFLVHGLLVTSHLLGVIFSAFLLASVAVLDRLEGRWRPWLYLSGAVSWLLLLPERTAIAASAQVGKPHFYTTRPSFRKILEAFYGFSTEIRGVLLVLGVVAALALWRRPGGVRPGLWEAYQRRRAVYVTTACMLLVPFAFLVQGALGTWLYTDRYLLPVTVALVFVTAEGLLLGSGLVASARLSRRSVLLGRLAAAGVFAGALWLWVFVHLARFAPGPLDYTGSLAALLPRTLPVVVEDGFSFPELVNPMHAHGVPYVFLLDWQQATRDTAPRVEVTQYHIMENLRRAGYLPDSVQELGGFLADNQRFLVLEAGPFPLPIGNPLVARFTLDPEYQVQRYAELDRGWGFRDTVWLVCRGTCSPAAPRPVQGSVQP